jgi:curved DNA-binding protein CbpA
MPHQITHYDVLGVKLDATEEEIRTAFRRLTREHHPDRFAGEQRARAEERFQSITEAFNILSHPDSRSRYDTDLSIRRPQSAGSTVAMDRKEVARRLLARGMESLRAGKYVEAIADLKAAVDHDEESSKAQYYYGFALSRVKNREREGLRSLERAIQLEPNNASFKAGAAVACMAVGLTSRAVRLAQEALALDPTSDKASKLLARVEAGEASKSRGLIDRLRKKG